MFVAPVIGAVAAYDEATRTASWTFTNDLGGGTVGLGSGSSLELILQVRFPAGSTPDGTVATNTASYSAIVDSTPTSIDSNPAPVAATATFEFEVRKSVRGGVAPLGLPVTYDVELCSPATGGLDLAAGATLRDTLPPGAVFVSANERWRRDHTRLGHRRVDTSCRRRRRRVSHGRQRDRRVPGGDIQRR